MSQQPQQHQRPQMKRFRQRSPMNSTLPSSSSSSPSLRHHHPQNNNNNNNNNNNDTEDENIFDFDSSMQHKQDESMKLLPRTRTIRVTNRSSPSYSSTGSHTNNDSSNDKKNTKTIPVSYNNNNHHNNDNDHSRMKAYNNTNTNNNNSNDKKDDSSSDWSISYNHNHNTSSSSKSSTGSVTSSKTTTTTTTITNTNTNTTATTKCTPPGIQPPLKQQQEQQQQHPSQASADVSSPISSSSSSLVSFAASIITSGSSSSRSRSSSSNGTTKQSGGNMPPPPPPPPPHSKESSSSTTRNTNRNSNLTPIPTTTTTTTTATTATTFPSTVLSLSSPSSSSLVSSIATITTTASSPSTMASSNTNSNTKNNTDRKVRFAFTQRRKSRNRSSCDGGMTLTTKETTATTTAMGRPPLAPPASTASSRSAIRAGTYKNNNDTDDIDESILLSSTMNLLNNNNNPTSCIRKSSLYDTHNKNTDTLPVATTVKKTNITRSSSLLLAGGIPKRNIFEETTTIGSRRHRSSPGRRNSSRPLHHRHDISSTGVATAATAANDTDHNNNDKFSRFRKQYGNVTNTAMAAPTTTTTDIYAIQDKGNYDMLHDECIYLCQNIVQQHQQTTTLTTIEQRIPMLRTCLSTVAELVYLLSSKKNRRTLLLRQHQNQSHRLDTFTTATTKAAGTTTTTNDDPLQAILNVFRSIELFLQNFESYYTDDDENDDCSNHEIVEESPSEFSILSLQSNNDNSSNSHSNKNNIMSTRANRQTYIALRQQILDALGMCLYFLSLDCTLSDDSIAVVGSTSSSNSTAAASKLARRIRKAFLRHDNCIRGIMHLILSDPFVRYLRGGYNSRDNPFPGLLSEINKDNYYGWTKTSPLTQMSSPLPSIRITKDAVAVTSSTINDFNDYPLRPTALTSTPSSVALSIPLSSPSLNVNKDVDAHTPDSQQSFASTDSVDPTLLGRLQRKRRRLELQQQSSALDQCEDDMSFSGMNGNDTKREKRDALSFTSKSPSPKAKRWNVSNQQFSSNTKTTTDDLSVASSTDSYMIKIRDKLDHVSAQIYESMQSFSDAGDSEIFYLSGKMNRFSKTHTCNRTMTDPMADIISSVVPLVSLTRIVTGKMEGNDISCMDDDVGQGDDGETNTDDYNPLLETNQMLSEGGAIPLLSQALAESLTAVSRQLELTNQAALDRIICCTECTECVGALHDRVSALVQLIDGASLLSSTNREQFCVEGYTNESGGYMVIGLLTVLNKKLRFNIAEKLGRRNLFDGVWDDIILVLLKMLTSLTHENATAAREMETPLILGGPNKEMYISTNNKHTYCGVYVVAEVLQYATDQMAEIRNTTNSHQDGKMLYDTIIFCLNILANFIESGGSCSIVANIMTHGQQMGNSCTCFLTWLTRWLVDETLSFREALVESTFGSSPSKHHDRQLDGEEDEQLVIAGNGFVLLSCLLIDEGQSNHVGCEDDSQTIPSCTATEIILNELPGTNTCAKLMYLKNTLKAFCNFYHFSIGDLSLAIVAPVKQLIHRLDSRFEAKTSQSP